MHETLAEDQLTKILVSSQQNGTADVGLPEDLLIGNAGRQLRHIENVMAVLSKPLHHRPIDTFIGNQVHAVLVLSG